MYEFLDSLVEEIGEENIVQVVTDSASAYVSFRQLLVEKRKNLFWSPCAAHCIDLILHDVSDLPISRKQYKGQTSSFKDNKIPFRAMFASQEWVKSHFSSRGKLIKFQYRKGFRSKITVKVDFHKTIEKMYPDIQSKIKIDQQLKRFKKAERMFGIGKVMEMIAKSFKNLL
ncbi:protein of unknown function DUF659 - like 1 [Theobroma cacao]|nr:protein of unknown function DUF659 - like 1 [Theobroma cacao]